jgi:biotin transport system substrate-specific component
MQNPHTAAAAEAQSAFVPLRFDQKSRLFQGGAILLGSLFLAICSWISVPMVPVPVTMQTFGVLVLGAMCGWRLAFSASLVYLAEGALGLPVFAGGAAGAHYLLGPTGGYLISFPLAAAFIGYLAQKGWTVGLLRTLGAMLLGHGFILTTGTAYLATRIGMDHALAVGFAPFLLGSILKSALASSIIAVVRRQR